MQFETYWDRCGVAAQFEALTDGATGSAAFAAQVRRHQAALAERTQPQALADLPVTWQFQVPELGEGGACSLFGQLAAEPYDLSRILGGRTPQSQALLATATAVTAYYQQHSRSHWFGIYQARPNTAGEPVLVKLAYFGAESRAEFPLTEAFAQGSNNSAVGLSGQGRIINDVAAFVAEGGGYYTCDPKVKAEACLPLFNAAGEVIGILDSEAFDTGFFHGDELALVVAVAAHLSGDSVLAMTKAAAATV
ncbi:GAF domain-containing protein [Roseateles terrae]|uniref:Methionine-R-sulfoxide reductase with GAF domain n=1 Tax=Roseateles terrae TaxID=431060 RepID=A0ABR6GW13_9BURK|nr:histidine kinase [Roseateles terrae]MBB3196296.1 putative methionine-R-sulfoxide reductase with GAF domain [Roseateles terrae]